MLELLQASSAQRFQKLSETPPLRSTNIWGSLKSTKKARISHVHKMCNKGVNFWMIEGGFGGAGGAGTFPVVPPRDGSICCKEFMIAAKGSPGGGADVPLEAAAEI
jgi:hypothetical protein